MEENFKLNIITEEQLSIIIYRLIKLDKITVSIRWLLSEPIASIPLAMYLLGELYTWGDQADYELASYYLNKSLDLYKTNKDKEGVILCPLNVYYLLCKIYLTGGHNLKPDMSQAFYWGNRWLEEYQEIIDEFTQDDENDNWIDKLSKQFNGIPDFTVDEDQLSTIISNINYWLGLCFYKYPNDKLYNPEKALEYFIKAADLGSTEVYYQLFQCYYNGTGCKKNARVAIEWGEKCIDTTNDSGKISRIQNVIGWLYYNGTETMRPNYSKAFELFKKNYQEYSNANSALGLGWCYTKGHGVSQDFDKAVEILQIALSNGQYNANLALGSCYSNKKNPKYDFNKAKNYFEAALDCGFSSGARNLAAIYESAMDRDKAYEYYYEAFLAGDNDALKDMKRCKKNLNRNDQQWYAMMHNMAIEKLEKKSNIINQDEKVFKLFKAATKGDIGNSYTMLGWCYLNGFGTNENIDLAIQYLLKAEEKNEVQALYALATCYFAKNDIDKGTAYLLKAATANDANAIISLAVMYHLGDVLHKDIERRNTWLHRLSEVDKRSEQVIRDYINITETTNHNDPKYLNAVTSLSNLAEEGCKEAADILAMVNGTKQFLSLQYIYRPVLCYDSQTSAKMLYKLPIKGTIQQM